MGFGGVVERRKEAHLENARPDGVKNPGRSVTKTGSVAPKYVRWVQGRRWDEQGGLGRTSRGEGDRGTWPLGGV